MLSTRERLLVAIILLVATAGIYFNRDWSGSDDQKLSSDVPVQIADNMLRPSDPKPPGDISGWTPVNELADDFTGRSVDRSKWGLYGPGPGNAGVGRREPSAITTFEGKLSITGKGDISGGMAQLKDQLYGRWDIRARMEKGAGYGPAILLWPQSGKWPDDGEVDIVELPRPERHHAVMSIHYGKDNAQQAQDAFGDFSQWHTYTLEWTSEAVVFYIDGLEQLRVTDKKAIPTVPMHLAIQNDVGSCGSWIGCRDENSPETVALHVDWVRVYNPA